MQREDNEMASEENVIKLKELAEKSGKSEVEIAKTIITLLIIKAEVYDIPQHVVLSAIRQTVGNEQ